MTTKDEAADAAIEVLNRIHKADPTVLPALMAYRVPCNETICDDPTVQVRKNDNGDWEVGLLGIINGIFGIVEGKEHGYIAAYYDDVDGTELTEFRSLGLK
jgi:hypothetical protein